MGNVSFTIRRDLSVPALHTLSVWLTFRDKSGGGAVQTGRAAEEFRHELRDGSLPTALVPSFLGAV